ncbi:hypothetical protein ACPYPG_24775 [Streptomyces sp. FR-108]|uniref:hypothetical protein n=1 Tax=Streptomyces sp. FR-108 TaxID=3416665 RepID=UPI003CF52CB9
MTDWPVTELDPVRRLRVLAASLNAVTYADARLSLPCADVWAVVSDLEAELPHLLPGVRAFRTSPTSSVPPVPPVPPLTPPASEHGSAWAYGPFGRRARFDIVLRPGWCLMRSGSVVAGMAAVPEGTGTRFAVLGGLRPGWTAPVVRALRPLGTLRGHRVIARAEQRTALRYPPDRRPTEPARPARPTVETPARPEGTPVSPATAGDG